MNKGGYLVKRSGVTATFNEGSGVIQSPVFCNRNTNKEEP